MFKKRDLSSLKNRKSEELEDNEETGNYLFILHLFKVFV